MENNKSNTFAFILGLAIGAAGAIFLSNENNRKQIKDKYNKAKDTLGNKTGDVQNKIADTLDRAQDNVNEKLENTKASLRENANKTRK